MENRHLETLSKQIRLDIIKMWSINHAPLSGALSVADLYMVLFFRTLNLDQWANDPVHRARILPKTTAANALYATLKYAGLLQTEMNGQQLFYPPIVHKDKWGGDLDGTLTRNFGQAIGLAFYAKYSGRNNAVIAFISEGDLQAGVDHLAKLAAAWKLNNLTVVLDCNGVQSSQNVVTIDPSLEADTDGNYPKLRGVWENYGWQYAEIDGHNLQAIEQAFRHIGTYDTPFLIVAKTTKGKGVPLIEQDPVRFSHHLSGGELTNVVTELEQELRRTTAKNPDQLIKPLKLRQIKQRTDKNLHMTRIKYGTDDTPFYVLRDWLSMLRDENPEDVFILNTDNARPFEVDLPIYGPKVRSQHLQIGVNEKLALNVARGIANAGGFPIYTTPATHLQVVAEDLFHCALAKDPVLLVGIFAGVDLAFWGPSHTSNRDALLFAFPGVSIFQPATADDTRVILEGIYQSPRRYLPGYIRLPSMPFMKITDTHLRWSKFAHAFTNGFYWFETESPDPIDVLFIASGISLKECLDATAELEKRHIKGTVVNVLNLQSVNGSLLNALAKESQHIISAIDADPLVMTSLLWQHLQPSFRPKVTSLGVSGFSEESYSKQSVLSRNGMDAASLVRLAIKLVAPTPAPQKASQGS